MQIGNEILLQIIVWLGSISVILLGGIGSLVIYVYRKYQRDNDDEHSRIETTNSSEHLRIEAIITSKCLEISENLCTFRREFAADIKDVHRRIDKIIENSKPQKRGPK